MPKRLPILLAALLLAACARPQDRGSPGLPQSANLPQEEARRLVAQLNLAAYRDETHAQMGGGVILYGQPYDATDGLCRRDELHVAYGPPATPGGALRARGFTAESMFARPGDVAGASGCTDSRLAYFRVEAHYGLNENSIAAMAMRLLDRARRPSETGGAIFECPSEQQRAGCAALLASLPPSRIRQVSDCLAAQQGGECATLSVDDWVVDIETGMGGAIRRVRIMHPIRL